MKIVTACLLTCFSLTALAQIKYEPGYVIFSDGQRTECEIRNVDWESNPTSFQYRIAAGEPKEGDLKTVKEFGITGGATFKLFTVDIDRSSDIVANLSKERDPEFRREVLFLRLLQPGKATLYEYVDNQLKRYFYAVDGKEPVQLVYKRYMQQGEATSGRFDTGLAATNAQYRQQLFNDLKCSSVTEKKLKELEYKRADLMKFFEEYNECTGQSVNSSELAEKKGVTHISLRPGFFSNGLSVDDGSTVREFEKSIAFRLGLEIEFVLPFNNGMWAFTLEPSYQSYSSKYNTAKVDYSAIDLNVNLRRYLSISEGGSWYINVGAAYGIPISGSITGIITPMEISSGINLAAGLGFRTGKFSAELNYAFGRGLLGNYVAFNSSYGGPGLILGYRLK